MTPRRLYHASLGAAGLLIAIAAFSSFAPGTAPAASKPRLFVSVAGSDSGRCTRAAPCASFARAYRVAAPGDVVEVAAGVYPGQRIVRDPVKAGRARVTFRPAHRATVVLGGLGLGTSVHSSDGPRGLAIKRMTIADASGKKRGIAAFNGTSDVVLEDIRAANFYLNGIKRFTILGGDWGPCLTTSTGTQSNERVDGCSNSKIDGTGNEDVVIRNAVFHDYRIIPGSGAHFECLFVLGVDGLKIQRNRFEDCEFYAIFFQNLGNPTSNVLIEGNWFETPWNGHNVQNRSAAVEFSPRKRPFTNFVIQRNSFRGAGSLSLNGDADGTVYSGFRVGRNIAMGYAGTCYANVRFLSNIWIPRGGSTCHGTDRLRIFGYVAADGSLRPAANEVRTVRRIFRSIARGGSPAAVARALTRDGVPAPTGGWWNTQTVRDVATDRVYRGAQFGAPGAHPPLVTVSSWQAAQRALRK